MDGPVMDIHNMVYNKIGFFIHLVILNKIYPFIMEKIVNLVLKIGKNMKTIGNISITIYMFKFYF